MDTPYAIEMLHITKRFPGIIANDDITLRVKKGEIHALLGENGAGKSTLMSVLFGLYQPEQGKILKNGKEVAIRNPNDANALGIGMVHQHFKLVECFSVLDNIILGVEPNKMGFLQKAEARKKVMALSEKYGLRVDPDALVSDISVGMQQRVEILKMLYRDNEILIFDEPTAVLTPQEIDELMEIMRGFKKEGKSILFISHKLNEIMAVADRCTVLRKGKYMGTVDIKDTTKEELSRMMVGRDVQLQVDKKPANPGEVVLDVENVTMHSAQHKKDAVRNVSLQVHAGEIVCLAGIEGNGQTEFVYGLTGLEKISSGKITLDGKDITFLPDFKRSKAIGRMFQDPLRGTAPHMTIEENLALAFLRASGHTSSFSRISKKDRALFAERLSELGLGLEDRMKQPVGLLSGGQRQALTLLMATLVTPKLLLLDEHTAALDPATADKVLELTKKIVAENHLTCLMITHNMHDALTLGNRTLMMDHGRIVLDIGGEERAHTTVDGLLNRFAENVGHALDNDRILLSKEV